MLKNSSLLWIIYGILFFFCVCAYLFTRAQNPESPIVFSYPDLPIEIAGEEVPMDNLHYDVKERFDKEFLNASNNIYQFYLYVKRAPLYLPYIENALKDLDLPDDIKYLAIAESALKNDIVSHAWAAWIWQFVPETAKRYGLRVDENIDERYHFEKSTKAALSYLSDLYDIFGDWSLAFAAYNRWENGLRRDMQEQGVKSYYDLYLNEETSRYVFRILAIKYVMLSYEERKKVIDKLIGGVYERPQTKIIRISSIDDIWNWCMQNNINIKDFKLLNPWIVGNVLPAWDWEIQVLVK